MKTISTVIRVLFVLFINTNCTDDIARSTLTQQGDQIPNFQIDSIKGGKFDTDLLQGKVILLNFFATWCPPCHEELPYLQKLSEQYQGKEFVLLSIGREHNLSEVEDFVAKKGLTYAFAVDPERKVYNKFATQYIPRTYLINRDGIIVRQTVGFDPNEFKELTGKITELLSH